MANEEHLEILRQAIEKEDMSIWNQWRDENPDLRPDLSGANLANARIATFHPVYDPSKPAFVMPRLVLENEPRVDFSKTDFTKANLMGADLHGTDCTDANFSEADLTKANLQYAILLDVNLSNANLAEAILSNTDMSNANASDARAVGAQIIGTNLDSIDLSRADLRMANISGSYLAGANITGANLCWANLKETNVAFLIYMRKEMVGRYLGIRGIDSCYGDAIFKRDAQDQDFLDSVKRGYKGTRWKRLLFWLWSLIDFGRSLPRVSFFAIFLVLMFGTIYRLFPHMIDYGRHDVTWFTPYYFSFVTYTTLGFGDVTARCIYGEICVTVEVVLGYITLGLLLAILANTVARRS